MIETRSYWQPSLPSQRETLAEEKVANMQKLRQVEARAGRTSCSIIVWDMDQLCP